MDVQERLDKLPNGRLAGRDVDPLGYDADFIRSYIKPALWLYQHYFRVEVSGAEKIPSGPVMLVGNHSGQLPIDGLMIAVAVLLEAAEPRFVRSMADRWLSNVPLVSSLFSRTGQLEGTPDNCRALLERDEAVLVFPEGVRGICKPFRERYRLQRFGHGFMRGAASVGVPVVPVSVVGAEEQYVSLANLERVAQLLGLPALPVMPQLLLPFGALPLPTRYRICFGEPLRFSNSGDEHTTAVHVARVREVIAAQLRADLGRRRSAFL